jgi:hypothetical protein
MSPYNCVHAFSVPLHNTVRSQTDVSIQLCARVLYAIAQCCPLIRRGVTLFRDCSMVDTGDLLPSWWESPCRCHHAPDWFQRHLHKRDMMTLDLPRSLSQGSFITLSLSLSLKFVIIFARTTLPPFCLSYPIPLATAVAQWLRYCATNRNVAGSIPDGVTGIFHWHNPSYRTMVLGATQPLTEMSTRSISWG